MYALVATHNRTHLLRSRSLPSIVNQTSPVKGVILVDDSPERKVKDENRRIFHSYFQKSSNNVYLDNKHTPGAAGSWNFGFDWVSKRDPEAWVAILDDDDEWTEDHISTCLKSSENVNLVLASIRTLKDGQEIDIKTPKNIAQKAFYARNPGWQGSNTFIKVKSLIASGGFDEELLCTHDRDLAVRWFQDNGQRYSITGKATVIYHLESEKESLTTTSGHGKWTGLLQFLIKHRNKMDNDDIEAYKTRAQDLFGVPSRIFDLLDASNEHPGFPRAPIIGRGRFKRWKAKSIFKTRKWFGTWRSGKLLTKIFGPVYKRSRDQIEIDLTYACNLGCHDCNRSCRQAPESLEISLNDIWKFVSDSIKRNIEWKRIRLLGGEPTLHSQFEEILYILTEYKIRYPRTRLEVVTNGYQRKVKRQILRVPPFFHIENSMKTTADQSKFYSFNIAPCDLPRFDRTDFTNGCSNIEKCGMGLTPLGYYPCTLSGGIDRIAGWDIARKEIPRDSDDMRDILSKACPLCGRFIPRVFVPYDIMPQITKGQMTTTWKRMYLDWKMRSLGGE